MIFRPLRFYKFTRFLTYTEINPVDADEIVLLLLSASLEKLANFFRWLVFPAVFEENGSIFVHNESDELSKTLKGQSDVPVTRRENVVI